MIPVGRFAAKNGADVLAVATVQEGTALRDAGVDTPIMVMSPVLEIEAEQAAFYDLEVFVEREGLINALSAAGESCKRPVRVHLKVDTGLHRFGCRPDEVLPLARQIKSLPMLELVGFAQHFVDSAQDDAKTQRQIDTYWQLVADLNAEGITVETYQLANTAAALRKLPHNGNLVRVGLAAYGIDPFGYGEGNLTPVLTWKARVTSIHDVPAGDTVSYSSTFKVSRDSRIATLGVGYGDGYPRALSSRGSVAIEGHRAPVVGLVCMDQTLIDVTGLPNIEVGSTAELVGRNVPVGELAAVCQTNSHEIVTRIMSRVGRRYVFPD